MASGGKRTVNTLQPRSTSTTWTLSQTSPRTARAVARCRTMIFCSPPGCAPMQKAQASRAAATIPSSSNSLKRWSHVRHARLLSLLPVFPRRLQRRRQPVGGSTDSADDRPASTARIWSSEPFLPPFVISERDGSTGRDVRADANFVRQLGDSISGNPSETARATQQQAFAQDRSTSAGPHRPCSD